MHTAVHRWILTLLLATVCAAQAQSFRREGFVTDQAGVVDQASKERLQVILADLLNRTDYDVAFATVRTAPGGVENLADALARSWNADGNLGLIIVVAVDDRKWRIAPSSDLEGVFTDAYNNQLADRCFKPNFRAGHYGAGLVAAAEEIARRIPERAGGAASYPPSRRDTPPTPVPLPTSTRCGGPSVCTGIGCVVAFLFVMGILNASRRWSPGGWRGGGYWSRPYRGWGWGGGWSRPWGGGYGGYRSSGWSSGSSWGSSRGSSFRSSSSGSPRRTSFGGGGTSGSW